MTALTLNEPLMLVDNRVCYGKAEAGSLSASTNHRVENGADHFWLDSRSVVDNLYAGD
mgnify:CR=1 FL=1